MWQHNYEPLGGSLALSAPVAALPIVVLFLMLGVLADAGLEVGARRRWRRRWSWPSPSTACRCTLALISTVYGAAYGVFPIAWIVFASIMLYRLAVDTGKFEIIKDSVGSLTDDRRLQAMFIAFSFGAFIEGAAGFGAPVAVSGAMLAGLGFNPFYAAGICLLANTAPVAFGSIGIPVTTLAAVTGLPVMPLVGDGRPAVRDHLDHHPRLPHRGDGGPGARARGAAGDHRLRLSFAGMQFFVSNYIGPELTDILSSLTCIIVMVVVLKLWKPKTIMRLEGDQPITAAAKQHSGGEIFMAWLPYLLLVVFVLAWGEPSIKAAIDTWTNSVMPSFLPKAATGLNGVIVPGLHNLIERACRRSWPRRRPTPPSSRSTG